jgi:hypothetical protein
MDSITWTDRMAAPLDGVRRGVLTAARRGRPFRTVLGSRDRRVAWTMGVHACVALVLTARYPVLLFVLLPLALGVPHVISDLRYLVLRRTQNRRWRALVFSGCAAVLAVNVAALFGAHFNVARAEVLLGIFAVSGAAIAALVARLEASPNATLSRGALVLAAIAALGAVAIAFPVVSLVVLLHVHNVVALVLWLSLYRRGARAVVPPLFLIACGAALLISGALIPWTLHYGSWRGFGTNLLALSDWLAPGLPDTLAVGLTSSWIFLQSVHYLVWLVLVPTDERRGSGATSFRTSLRELVQDLGAPGAALGAVTWALVMGFGAAAPLSARNAYLALASFHVWLELAVLAFRAVQGELAFQAKAPALRSVSD